jgi:single-stranded DNA-binding protein
VSLHLLASGVLFADPQRREGDKGPFATARIRTPTGSDAILISVIAFGPEAERLLQLEGAPVAVGGKGELRTWTGCDGRERTTLTVVATELAATKPRPHQRDGIIRSRSAYRRPPARASGSGTAAPALNDDLGDLLQGGG